MITRRNFVTASAVAAGTVALAACSSDTDSGTTATSTSIAGTYAYHVGNYDFGAATDKLIVTLDAEVDSASADNFAVTETMQTTDFTDATLPIVETTRDRIVADAYTCDENGDPTDAASSMVALELDVSNPDLVGVFLYRMDLQQNTWTDPYYLTVTMSEETPLTSGGEQVESLTVDTEPTAKTTDADEFSIEEFTASDGVTIRYAAKAPETESSNLVVWLHGLGEGGSGDEATDPTISVLGSKATVLIGGDFQSEVGGAHILAPQCPTFWMDNDGARGNLNDGAINADGTSYYLTSLTELIDDYVASNGIEKVVLTGCSNGGYMVMVLALNDPEKYDAYVPVCEAMPDEYITDELIESIKDCPLYFIYSTNDQIVDPTIHEEPTITRLEGAGASALHVSTSDSVVDTSGRFFDAEGNPYEYQGHFAWVHFFNNEADCNDGDQTAWGFIADSLR